MRPLALIVPLTVLSAYGAATPQLARYGGPFIIKPKILAIGPRLEVGNPENKGLQRVSFSGWTFTSLDSGDRLVLIGGEDHDLVMGTGLVVPPGGKAIDLRDLGSLTAADALRLVSSKEPFQRARSVWALATVGDSQAVTTLSRAMKDEDWLVRRYALLSLWQKVDPKQAVSFALPAMEDKSSEVLTVAIKILVKEGKGDSRVQNAMVQKVSGKDWQVAVAAIDALGEIGDKLALSALQAAKSSKDPLTEGPLEKAIAQIQRRGK